MFWPSFERELVEEESCEKNMLLRDPSRSSLERDNVVYWKETKRKINNDLSTHMYTHTHALMCPRTESHPHINTHARR